MCLARRIIDSDWFSHAFVLKHVKLCWSIMNYCACFCNDWLFRTGRVELICWKKHKHFLLYKIQRQNQFCKLERRSYRCVLNLMRRATQLEHIIYIPHKLISTWTKHVTQSDCSKVPFFMMFCCSCSPIAVKLLVAQPEYWGERCTLVTIIKDAMQCSPWF